MGCMGYNVKELKEDYNMLIEKYKLPSFEKINEIFDIEKIDRKSEILLKIIRRIMIEKVGNVLNSLEMFMNPVQVPIMYHGFLKSMSAEDKKLIERVYTELAELVFDSIECDFKYDEKKEGEMINKLLEGWNLVSKDLEVLINKIKNPSKGEKKERSYFG